jgi:hypothetical protein
MIRRAGKQERQSFCLCRLTKQIRQESKEVEILIQQQTPSMLKKLKLQLEELPPLRRSGNQMQERRYKATNKYIVHIKRMYDKIKIAIGKIKPISLSNVKVPIVDSIIYVTDQDEIAETVNSVATCILLKPTQAY